jgi:hypothetical protein
MTARLGGVVVAGLLAAVGALAVREPGPTTTHRSTPTPHPVASPPPTPRVVEVARAYAIAARTWSPTTRLDSWRREVALAAGSYRRALLAARPTRAQRVALRRDRASSSAAVVTARSRADGHGGVVIVELRERTRVAGSQLVGVTRNRVTLRRYGGAWRVVGFTVVPGAQP